MVSQFTELLYGKFSKKVLTDVWFAVVWSIWWVRNYIIFKNGNLCIPSLLERVKALAWSWQGVDSKVLTFLLLTGIETSFTMLNRLVL